jgi:hypothetical protein
MSLRLTALIAILASLVGASVAAAVEWTIERDTGGREQGRVVTIRRDELWDGFPDASKELPVCSKYHLFCITQTEGGEFIAVYLIDTLESGRELGCFLYWEPDEVFDLPDPPVKGLFRSQCNGSRWDRTGERIFGPSPRDLDRFPLEVDDDYFKVDTRHLICGENEGDEPSSCDLAAPYD